MKELINPELKKSSIVLLFIVIIFIFIVNMWITFYFNNIKSQYIDGRAAMLSTMVEKFPNLEADLVEAAFKVPTNEEIKLGEKIIDNYGYKDNINIMYIDGINEAFKNSKF
ncbi:MAG TPA: hypothetical protein DCR69_03090, partial [Clostridium sp.]|nr:hypothetical protein [Clostridium sp.]